jgi:hypothetical protein
MKNLIFLFSIVLTMLALLGGCGNSGTGAGLLNDSQNQDTDEEGSIDGGTIDGLYMAKFMTLNPHVNGTIPGSLTLFRKEDRLLTFVRLFAGGPRTWHQQGIYLGRRCPDLGDDTNADGYIDITEAMNVVGKMIIPLDANMNSQMSGRNFFPISDLSGYYHYERVSSFRRLFDDLRTEDLDAEDHISKLAPDEKFSFLGRVVLVQGVMQDTILPETVAAIGKRKAFQTLPITCGIITKVAGSPAEPDSGEIPGPVAEVIEGQDQPAPAGEGETDGDTGSETGGGTNENEEGEVGDDAGSRGGSTGGTTTGGTTTGGTTTGGTTTGGTTTGGTTTGGTTTGGTTTGGTTTGGSTTGGFVGGFIGGFVGGDDKGI